MTFRTRSHTRQLTLPRLPLVLSVWLALACGSWALLRGVEYVLLALRYAAPLDGQEGMALWEAALLRNSLGLYLPVVPSYFVSAPYPPLHPVLLAVFGHSTTPHLFWAGRVISLVAALLVAVCGFGLVRRVTGSKQGGVSSAVLILAFAPVQLWAMRIKPDMVGLALTIAGLWLVARWPGEPAIADARGMARRAWKLPSATLVAAASAFVLAHFTKQTLLAGPLAAATFLMLHDWRLAVRWGLLYLLLLAGTWLLLDLVTHGQYTYHIWVLHKLQWSGDRFWKLASQLRDMWPLLVLGLIGLVVCHRQPTVINAYLLWAPASLIGAGVVGSHHNHLLETGVALVLAGGQAVGLGMMSGGTLRVLAPVLIGTQLLFWRVPLPWFSGDFQPDLRYSRYIDYVRATPGEVLADDVGLVYAAGRPLFYDDPAAMGPAAALGLWDQRQFVADIRAKRYSAIILPMNVFEDGLIDPSARWTPEMLQAVKDAYTVKFKDTLIIYAPRP